MPPILFGKYRLLRKLAQGGMAEIYLAKSTGAGGFEKTVIVKRILPKLSAHDKFVRMFINEAKVTSNLSHSNIVQIFDFGRVAKDYFIAMEYVDGKDLRSIIRACRDRRRRVPLEFALYTGAQVTKALDYAHTRCDMEGQPLQIIHRDVSPQNVLLSRQGEIKLTDFGIAKATGTLSETVANEIKGNFGYMPPEQATGQPLDSRCDVYAAAMVLYELLTLKNPFADTNLLAVIHRIKEMPVPPPSELNPGVTRGVDRILLKGLAKDPEARFASAGEMCAALSEELFPSPTELIQASYAAFLDSMFPPEISPSKSGRVPAPAGRGRGAEFQSHSTLAPRGESESRQAAPDHGLPPPKEFAFSRKPPRPAIEVSVEIEADGSEHSQDPSSPLWKPDRESSRPVGLKQAAPPGPVLSAEEARFARKVRDAANMGRLRLDVAPSAVAVFIDATQVADGAPIEIQTSAKIEHVLELRCAGFSEFATTFVLSPGEVRDFQIVLAERR